VIKIVVVSEFLISLKKKYFYSKKLFIKVTKKVKVLYTIIIFFN